MSLSAVDPIQVSLFALVGVQASADSPNNPALSGIELQHDAFNGLALRVVGAK